MGSDRARETTSGGRLRVDVLGPIRARDAEARDITPDGALQRRLLALLATGAADDTIARTLGISRRTFFRYLERLMNRTGASTRFQLALHAARENWL